MISLLNLRPSTFVRGKVARVSETDEGYFLFVADKKETKSGWNPNFKAGSYASARIKGIPLDKPTTYNNRLPILSRISAI